MTSYVDAHLSKTLKPINFNTYDDACLQDHWVVSCVAAVPNSQLTQLRLAAGSSASLSTSHCTRALQLPVLLLRGEQQCVRALSVTELGGAPRSHSTTAVTECAGAFNCEEEENGHLAPISVLKYPQTGNHLLSIWRNFLIHFCSTSTVKGQCLCKFCDTLLAWELFILSRVWYKKRQFQKKVVSERKNQS